MAEVVRAAYQEVFIFVDPESDTEERIRDAFRVYEPLGQLNRMVSLFLGLCVEAGLRPATSIRSARPQQSSRPAQARPSVEASRRRRDGGESPNAWSAVKGPASQGTGKAPQIHPAIVGLLNDLPVRWGAWTVAERDGFMQTFPPHCGSLLPDAGC